LREYIKQLHLYEGRSKAPFPISPWLSMPCSAAVFFFSEFCLHLLRAFSRRSGSPTLYAAVCTACTTHLYCSNLISSIHSIHLIRNQSYSLFLLSHLLLLLTHHPHLTISQANAVTSGPATEWLGFVSYQSVVTIGKCNFLCAFSLGLFLLLAPF
jgi:hypothetical protein